MKFFLLPIMLGVAPLATLVSDNVPTWNVEVSCKGAIAADKAENFADIQTVDACMKDEADARNQLVKTWGSFTAPLRTRCEGEAGANNLPSYVDLLVCLQISSDTGNKPAAATPASLKGAGKHRRKPAAR